MLLSQDSNILRCVLNPPQVCHLHIASETGVDEVRRTARKLKQLGLYLYGTGGTIDFLNQIGVEGNMLRKVQEGSPNVIDMMREVLGFVGNVSIPPPLSPVVSSW